MGRNKGNSLEASPPFQVVDLKDINVTPGPYCMSFGFEIGPLVRSIRAIGLVNPPLLMVSGQGRLAVIAGYRRIWAIQALRKDTITCRVFSDSELSPLECLLLSLHDNLATRKLNEVEKGMVLSRLSSYLSSTEIITHYMPMLGLPSHEPTFLLYRDIEEVLERETKDCLARGLLSLHAAKILLGLDHNARSCLSQLIAELKFNINQQKQFIDYIIDLSYKNQRSVPAFLENHPLNRICADIQMNTPQKARAVLMLLRRERNPVLARSEKTFKERLSRVNLPCGTAITHPPFFEAPDYRLEVLFRDGRELRHKLGQLSGLEGIEDLKDPWEEST